MNEMVEAETGFVSCGIIYLAETQADLARFEDWLDHARQYQLDSRIIGSAEIARRLPGIAKEYAGALFTATDGKAEPQMAGPAIARAARRLGATILTGCAVRCGRPRGRCGYRKEPNRLRLGGVGRRRLVAFVLRQVIKNIPVNSGSMRRCER